MKPSVFKLKVLGLLAPLLFIVIGTLAQTGTPYLTHFKLPSGFSSQNWAFEQDDNGLMYVLNRKGIFSFDGLQWADMGVIGRPLAIAYYKNLFFCSDKGVGRFLQNENGTFEQQIILDSKDGDVFYSFFKIESGLLVVSPQVICAIRIESEVVIDTIFYNTSPQVFISDVFSLNGKVYHVKNRALIYSNEATGSVELIAGLPVGEDFTFSFLGDKSIFLGSTYNKLYSFDGAKLVQVPLKSQKYLSESILNGGKAVRKDLIALSTLNGGCILLNPITGETSTTLNFFNGLPDDEVFSLGTDRDGGLWISHGMGITRADLIIPLRNFGFYPGLKGNMFSGLLFGGQIYVGSSEGLFLLVESKQFKAVDVVVKKSTAEVEKKSESDAAKLVESPHLQQTEISVEAKKRSFLSRVFSRRSEKATDKDKDRDPQVETANRQNVSELPVVKRRIYELQQVSHDYKRIAGVEGKVRQLIRVGRGIVAATSMGLFEVLGTQAKPIAAGKNVTFAETLRFNPEGFMIGTDKGAYMLERNGFSWHLTTLFEVDNQQVLSLVQLSSSDFIVTTEFDVFLLKRNASGQFNYIALALPAQSLSSPVARLIKGKVIVFTSGKAFAFHADGEKFIPTAEFQYGDGLIYSQMGYTWLRINGVWQCLSAEAEVVPLNAKFMGLLESPNSIFVNDDGTLIAVNSYTQLYRFGNDTSSLLEKEISAFVNQISTGSGLLLSQTDIKLDYNNNSLKIRVSAPTYLADGGVEFQYSIAGLTREWSDWNANSTIDFPYFPSGEYTIMVRARDSMGRVSNAVQVNFEVKPPFWQTPVFFVGCGVVLVFLLIALVKVRERNLRRERDLLEQKVRERTKTIEEQKEELVAQRDELERFNHEILQQKEEIEAQRDEIEVQRDQIYKQNDEITKSIAYAKRIQAAVMPSKELVKSYLPKSFVLFRPRDIVSGDFYWMSKRKDRVVVVAADCTGHGVPGAFMSMMGVTLLNDIVNASGEVEPQVILNELRYKIKETLSQSGREGESKDGMDVAVCVIDNVNRKLFYSGAYNSLYFFRKNELNEIKADKMPVGIHITEKDSFTLHEIDLLLGDRFYIASDGYVSQFGGVTGKKFMAKPFKDLLTAIQDQPLAAHQQMLEDSLDRWQGAYDQVDDILVIGVEV